MSGKRTFPPNNPWYWFEDGTVIPVEKIPTAIHCGVSRPDWELLAHQEGLLREAIEWYLGMAERGEDALPAHMKSHGETGMTRLHVAQASAYQRISELKGLVEEHRRALIEKKVPRVATMFADRDVLPHQARRRAARAHRDRARENRGG